MNDTIRALLDLNSKERFYVVKALFGIKEMRLSDFMRGQIFQLMGLRIPDLNYVFIDYHQDWVTAALTAKLKRGRGEEYPNSGRSEVHGTQADFDVIVAFEQNTDAGSETGSETHLLFIEAKGVLSWGNDQLRKKADWLKKLFGAEGKDQPPVSPHFAIMAPHYSDKIKTEDWPKWMLNHNGEPYFLELDIPDQLWKVSRCDVIKTEADTTQEKATYASWEVVKRTIPNKGRKRSKKFLNGYRGTGEL